MEIVKLITDFRNQNGENDQEDDVLELGGKV